MALKLKSNLHNIEEDVQLDVCPSVYSGIASLTSSVIVLHKLILSSRLQVWKGKSELKKQKRFFHIWQLKAEDDLFGVDITFTYQVWGILL